jgi:hypothetical protein
MIAVKSKRKYKHRIQTDYLDKVYHLDQFRRAVNLAVKRIKKFEKEHPFEAIAFTGISGAAFAFPLSLQLNKPLICVRKRKDNTHYGDIVEGCTNATSYIIVDDFIASGKTISRIMTQINRHRNDFGIKFQKPKLVGIYLYDDCNNKYKFIYDNGSRRTGGLEMLEILRI